jgi:PAS domain S-box-containing protein
MSRHAKLADVFDSTRNASLLGLLYFGAGALWITLSDAVLDATALDPAWMHAAQTYKGLAYIAVTTIGLVVLVRMGHRHQASVLERARARELHAQEVQQERFHQLHQSLGEVLWTGTPDGRQVLYVSPAFADIYGRSPAELLARPALWLECVHPEDRDRVMASSLAPRQAVTLEYRIVRPDGSVRWVEDRKKLICDSDGSAVMMGGIAEDITARKERDEAQGLLKHRLERLVAERTRALEQANLELEAFSRTAAHDLKTPLNGIVGLSRLVKTLPDTTLGAQGQRFVDQIERAACDMAVLINDLLTLSRASTVGLQCQQVDLLPMAQAVVDGLRSLEPLRDVQVQMPAELQAWCDPGLMRSVLQNLIGNAWKFSAERAQAVLELGTDPCEGGTQLWVSDNGSGFDTSAVQGLFRPFQRFHSQAQFQGTGIGLVTCQRIAQRHGGRLTVVSTPGAGTRVCVWLPAAPVA